MSLSWNDKGPKFWILFLSVFHIARDKQKSELSANNL